MTVIFAPCGNQQAVSSKNVLHKANKCILIMTLQYKDFLRLRTATRGRTLHAGNIHAEKSTTYFSHIINASIQRDR